MDRGTWQATVHRVAKSWTWLKRLTACTQETRALNHLLSDRVRFTLRTPPWTESAFTGRKSGTQGADVAATFLALAVESLRVTPTTLCWQKSLNVKVLVIQSCPALCDSMVCSSPAGSSVHGILQARTLEWVAIPFSSRSSQPRDWAEVSHITGRFFTIWATREDQINSMGFKL